jgi:hypothetical protein
MAGATSGDEHSAGPLARVAGPQPTCVPSPASALPAPAPGSGSKGGEPTGTVRTRPAGRLAASLGLALVVAVVGGVLAVALSRRDDPVPADTSTDSPGTSSVDDTNPQTTDACAQSAVTVRGSRTPIVRGGHSVGVLELRFSTACNTAWARAVGVPVVPQPDFHLVTVRASDQRTTQDTFGATRHINERVAFNNQLLSAGCIEAEAWFGTRRQGIAFTHTRCLADGPEDP